MITISLSYKTKNSFIEEKLILLINHFIQHATPRLTYTEDFVAVMLPRRLCLPGARLL